MPVGGPVTSQTGRAPRGYHKLVPKIKSSPVETLLERYTLSLAQAPARTRLFRPVDAETLAVLVKLYETYADELRELAIQLRTKYAEMRALGYQSTFGDIEGELLYMLIRETRPELVYEISPNYGYSTNYILAAVTRNGTGKVEGFELLADFSGKPAAEVIQGNLVSLCDGSLYHLNSGDAQILVPRRLQEEHPDFILIDSCHDDYFADFYLKQLLNKQPATVFLQDMCHFDPRPEFSSEASYMLSFLQETDSRFLPIGLYEDDLQAATKRMTFAERQPNRSNSIVLTTLGSPDGGQILPSDEHYYSLIRATNPAGAAMSQWKNEPEKLLSLVQLTSLSQAGQEAEIPGALLTHLDAQFENYDPWCQTLILQVVSRLEGQRTLFGRLLDRIQIDSVHGAEIPLRLAQATVRAGDRRQTREWLERATSAAQDKWLAVGFRNLLASAKLYAELGDSEHAVAAFRLAIQHIASRSESNIREQGSREVFYFVLRHPRFLKELVRGSHHLDARQLPPTIARLFPRLIEKLAASKRPS